MTNSKGGLLNDTLVLCIDENYYWILISDSDMFCGLLGLVNLKMKVIVRIRHFYTCNSSPNSCTNELQETNR